MYEQYIEVELEGTYFDNGPEVTPEHSLWIAVIVLALEDLDATCRLLNNKLVPMQAAFIVKALNKKLIGQEYWFNRRERKQLIRQKAICKREMYRALYDIKSKWFVYICELGGVSEHLVQKLAQDIIDKKIKTKFNRGNEELNTKLYPRNLGPRSRQKN